MKEEILKNFNLFLDYAKQGVDFIKDQAPLYIQELIKYNICLYSFYSFICVICLIIGIILAFKAYNFSKEDYYDNEGIVMSFSMISLCAIPISLGFLIYNIKMLLTVYMAPRVFIMDYLLNIIKGN
jgi:hypothetical protein